MVSLENGSISEQGSFDELRAGTGYVSSLDLNATTSEQTAQGTNLHDQPPEYAFGAERNYCPQPSDSNAAARQIGDGAVYMYYFRASGLANFAIYFGLQLAWATLGNFPSMSMQIRREIQANRSAQQFGCSGGPTPWRTMMQTISITSTAM